MQSKLYALETEYKIIKDRNLARASAISEIEMVLSFDLSIEQTKAEMKEILDRLKVALGREVK